MRLKLLRVISVGSWAKLAPGGALLLGCSRQTLFIGSARAGAQRECAFQMPRGKENNSKACLWVIYCVHSHLLI